MVPFTSMRMRNQVVTMLRWQSALLSLAILSTGCGGSKSTSPPVKPLPDSAFRAEWQGADLPATIARGSKVKVTVNIRNASDQTWRDSKTAAATEPGSAIRLSYRWLGSNGAEVSGYTTRFDLPRSVPPNESVSVPIEVVCPAEPGSYQVQFDLLQENVSWFDPKGAKKLLVPVTVT